MCVDGCGCAIFGLGNVWADISSKICNSKSIHAAFHIAVTEGDGNLGQFKNTDTAFFGGRRPVIHLQTMAKFCGAKPWDMMCNTWRQGVVFKKPSSEFWNINMLTVWKSAINKNSEQLETFKRLITVLFSHHLKGRKSGEVKLWN